MSFAIDDQPVIGGNLPKAVQEILATLDALADGRLLTSQTLAGQINRAHTYLARFATHNALAAYRARRKDRPNQLVWGNPRTIAAYSTQHA